MATHVKSATQNSFVSAFESSTFNAWVGQGALTQYSPYWGEFFPPETPFFFSLIACCYIVGKFETELISKGMSVLS